MDASPGSYAVILRNKNRKTIRVGIHKELFIEPGYYVYLGSAFGPGGIRARVGRHSRCDKPRRWHIDYVREHMAFHDAWYSHRPVNQEHRWARLLKSQAGFVPLAGIGCSDCDCETHLFFSHNPPDHRLLISDPDETIERWRNPVPVDSAG